MGVAATSSNGKEEMTMNKMEILQMYESENDRCVVIGVICGKANAGDWKEKAATKMIITLPVWSYSTSSFTKKH